MSEMQNNPFDELMQQIAPAKDTDEQLVQGTGGGRELLYNFAFIDEDSKREVRQRRCRGEIARARTGLLFTISQSVAACICHRCNG